jgi:hypothetical protein
MVSAFAIDYGCHISLGTPNGTQKGSVLAEKIADADRSIDLDSQLSRQPLVTFELRFVFSDRLNIYKGLQRQDTFRCANRRLQLYQARSPLLMLLCEHNDSQFFWQPLVAFEPCFMYRTDLTSLITAKARKHSAARIGDGDFELPAPFLSHVQRP